MSTTIHNLRSYFASGATQSYAFRIQQLERLKKAVLDAEKQLYQALYTYLLV